MVIGDSNKKLLLHICCVGCGVYISEELKSEYDITLFFYNPNIFPVEEYKKRLHETKRISEEYGLKLVISENDHKKWLQMVKGLESEPEKGKRCEVCFRDRLKKTAEYAQNSNFDYFATTLTTSPHKDAALISRIGNELSKDKNIKYLDKDFKKNEGFKKSCAVSRKLNLYRQNYCGCEFSIRDKK